MENKNGSGHGVGSLGGKGFYIVLFLCAAVIGVSAWLAITEAGTNVEDIEAQEPVVDVSGAYVTMIPADQAMRTDGDWLDEEPEEDAETAETEPEEDAEASEETEPETQAVFAETVDSYVWPVQGTVQRPYSVQALLYDSTMADWRTHDGIDLACSLGEPVIASAAGTVMNVTNDDLLGTVVEIDHGNGTHTIYANLASQPPVAPGQIVTMGQTIGSVGNTALGEVNQVSHLHFAMTKDGLTADPMAYLPSQNIQ